MGWRLALVTLYSLWFGSGCGILVQTIVGWNDVSTARVTKTHQVSIESTPPGAQVVRTSPDGSTQTLGATPLTDEVRYEVDQTTTDPKAWGLLGTGLGEVVAGGILAAVGRNQRECVYSDFYAEELCSNSSAAVPLISTGSILLVFGAVDVIWGLIRVFRRPRVTKTEVIGEPTYAYEVSKDRQVKVANIPVPKAKAIQIELGGAAPAVVKSEPPPPPVEPPPPPVVSRPPDAARVIAVMDVEDANAGTNGAVGDSLVRNLSDQIRVYVTQQGARTIDRSAQERAFRQRVQEVKNESYKDCYDDTCQIELGKALAASHILRSKITKFGTRCVLNGELIDLAAEVTVKAASAQGACEAEGFLEMSEAVARDLMGAK